MLGVSGVVVLYHPDASVIDNIQSYIDCIDKLYVVDNSALIDSEIIAKIKKIDKCIYVNNEGNLGLALALNVGAEMALDNDAGWLLTMDQDSRFKEGALMNMIQWLNNNDANDVGIITPVHKTAGSSVKFCNGSVEASIVMTSGNLLNLEAYLEVGPFREDFFIDYVDHEYCLRLKNFSYKILIHCESILEHNLGESKQVNFFGFTTIYTSHNRVRRYYITRNRLSIIKEYWLTQPVYCIKDVRYFFSSWLKIVLFDKNAIAKQKSILLGVLHFFQGKSGKLSAEGYKHLTGVSYHEKKRPL